MSKSPAKRIEYLEEIVIGAGFLLKKIHMSLGHEFGAGMDEQVRQCIRDCDEVGKAHLQRKAREAK